jgi:hypothetical protein
MNPAALVVLGLLLRGAQAAAAGNAGLDAAHAVRPLTSSSSRSIWLKAACFWTCLEADSSAEQAPVTVPQRVAQEPGSALAAVNRGPARQAGSKLHLLLGQPLMTRLLCVQHLSAGTGATPLRLRRRRRAALPHPWCADAAGWRA